MLLAGLDDQDRLVQFNVINFLGSKGRAASFALDKLREMADQLDLPENIIGLDGSNFSQALERAISNIE